MALSLATRVGLWFKQLNIFENGVTDAKVVRQQRWSTRLYMVLFITLVIVFAARGGTEKQIIEVAVSDPSYDTFQSLQKKYPNTLKCPCTNIAVEYQSFIQIQPIFHQVLLLIATLLT